LTISYQVPQTRQAHLSPQEKMKKTAKLERLAAGASSMIADPLQATLTRNLAALKENEVAEEKIPVVFDMDIAFTQKRFFAT